jgi:hypothetical protein
MPLTSSPVAAAPAAPCTMAIGMEARCRPARQTIDLPGEVSRRRAYRLRVMYAIGAAFTGVLIKNEIAIGMDGEQTDLQL